MAVHLSDSYCLTRPSLYISNLLLALRAMLQMDLPHVNILSKIDRVASYGPLPFNLDYYTDVQDLTYLLPYLDEEEEAKRERRRKTKGKRSTAKKLDGNSEEKDSSSRSDPEAAIASSSASSPPSPAASHQKWSRLNTAVADLVESFGLVRFEVLAVEDRSSMTHVLRVVDRAGGYVFGPAEGAGDSVWQLAMRDESSLLEVRDIQERWVDHKDSYDEAERQQWQKEAAEAGDADSAVVSARFGQTTPAASGPELDGDDDLAMFPPPDLSRSGIKVVRKKT